MSRYRIFLCGADPDPPLVDPNPACRNAAAHVPRPRGYLEWHEWAERMSETYEPQRCEGCGQWLILKALATGRAVD